MSAPQAAAITACTACAAVGGAAAGGAFSSGSAVDENHIHEEPNPNSKISDLPNSLPAPEKEPEWYPLTVESNQQPYSSKIGKDYGHLFVAPFGTTEKPTQEWWNKSYKKYEEDKKAPTNRAFSPEFSDTKVTKGFDSSNGNTSTALNKVCDSIYKKTKDSEVTIFHKANPTENKDKLREDLWRYCSPLGASPINLEDQTDTYTNGKIGNSKKGTLLSAKDNDNTVLWKIKQQEFFGLSKVTDTYFKDLWSKKDTKKSEANSFRDKCNDAYGKASSGQASTEPTEAKVEEYCSLKAMPIEQ